MTQYLLDTNVLIDFSKGIESVTEQLLAWIDSTDIVAVCAMCPCSLSVRTVAEHNVPITDW